MGDPVEIEKYKAALAEAVDDGRLTDEEAGVLTSRARLTRLTGTQLRQLNQQAREATFAADKDVDWASLTPARRSEMYLLAGALGLSTLAETINGVIRAGAEPEPSAQARYLRSLRIAIVGDDNDAANLRARAESYGVKLAVNITKTVRWMATATPDARDSRHLAARKLSTPMVSFAAGSIRLDEAIREAELKAAERQKEIDESIARSRQRVAANDAYWRPTWRTHELAHDPGPPVPIA